MIEIRVSHNIDVSQSKAFEVLRAWELYPNWWPVRVTTCEAPEFALVVFPLPLVRIFLVPEHIESGKRIVFRYVRGPFRGTGTWELVSCGEGGVTVSYSIALNPTNWLVAALASTAAFRSKHCHDIRSIVKCIERVVAVHVDPTTSSAKQRYAAGGTSRHR